ncbi:unnamed protein product [Thelazia callipaeda]|uniref:Cofac_haem_bdg domain-containing protein n=1 Tax=Thelazia callipaeda TaxID=103827 RepID=A0A0N5CUL7_THECL|nr:unnamed protein product [Thelazia callipaeda]
MMSKQSKWPRNEEMEAKKELGKENRIISRQQVLGMKIASRDNYVDAMYEEVSKDLRNVLVRDLLWRINSIAFRKLERWMKYKRLRIVETGIPRINAFSPFEIKETLRLKDSLNETVRPVTEQTRAEILSALRPDAATVLGSGHFFKDFRIVRNVPPFEKVCSFIFLRSGI